MELRIFLILPLLLPLISCCGKDPAQEIAHWRGKIYAFTSDTRDLDPNIAAVCGNHFYFTRAQSNEKIPVTDPVAGNMLGFTEQDLESFMNTYVVNPPVCK